MRAYPEYRESGVEWFATVPAGWETKRLRHMAQLQTEKATTSDNQIALENIEGWSGRIIETESEFSGDGVAFESGDILFGKLRPYLAKVALAEGHGAAVGDFHVLRPLSDMLPRFLQYLLLTPSVISIIDGSTYGSKMPRVSWDFMADLRLPVPSLAEQRAIADFLDREVAKIDALIEESRALIAALAEKRQATISHAVTRGLNPAARLKPSGVDWLGDIPEGWEIGKLRYWLRDSPCYGVLVPDDAPDGIPMIRIMDMHAPEINHESLARISVELSREYSRTIIEAGDVLLSVVGTIGATKVVPQEAVGYNLSRAIARLRPRETISAEFLSFIFQSGSFVTYVDLTCVGTAQRVLNMTDLSAFRVAIPPMQEQQSIVDFLIDITARLDALTGEAEAAIALLQERRAALISAAVTGKIDVRDTVQAA